MVRFVRDIKNVRLEYAVAAILGVFMLFFGGRSALASYLTLPSRDTLELLQTRQDVQPEQVTSLVQAYRRSTQIHETGRDLSSLSLGLVILAQQADNDPELQRKLYVEADAALRRSLALEPANPYAWTRLAAIARPAGLSDPEIRRVWQLAVMTGPSEDKLLVPRIQIAMSLWPALSNSDVQSVYADIRNLWHRDFGWQIANDANQTMVNAIMAALVVDKDEFTKYIVFERDRQIRLHQQSPK